MSILGIHNFILGDLLTEHDMKPWWEKIRGYLYSGSVATVLFMFYLTQTMKIECVPMVQNGTFVDAAIMNNYCINQIPWFVTYSGFLGLSSILLVLIVSASWLQIPGVRNSFNTFKKAEQLIEGLSDENDKLQSSVAEPLSRMSDCNVREAWRLLLLYKCDIRINFTYFIRNIALLFAICLSLSISGALVCFLAKDGNTFHCNPFQSDYLEINGEVSPAPYFCSCNTAKQLIPYWVGFSASMMLQFVFVLLGMCKMRYFCDSSLLTTEETTDGNAENDNIDNILEIMKTYAKKTVPFIIFMIRFWESSNPGRSVKFCEIVKLWISDESLKESARHYTDAITLDKKKNIELFCITKDPEDWEILEKVEQKLSKGKITAMAAEKFLQNKELTMTNPYTEKLMDIAKKTRDGFLTVVIINQLKETAECENFVEDLDLNVDSLDIRGRSILYYALSDQKYFKAARTILKSMKDGRTKYVHCNYQYSSPDIVSGIKTTRAVVYVEKVFNNIHNMEEQDRNEDYEALQDLILESEVGGPVPSKSQEALKELLGELKDTEVHGQSGQQSRNEQTTYLWNVKQLEGVLAHTGLQTELSTLLFTNWDDTAKEIARFAIDKKYWDIFVKLLNSFIVIEENEGLNIQRDCGVNRFHNFEVLMTACRHTNFDRATTALEHILACTLPQQKDQIHPGLQIIDHLIEKVGIKEKIKRKIAHSMKERFRQSTTNETRINLEENAGPSTSNQERQHNVEDNETENEEDIIDSTSLYKTSPV